MDNTDLAMLRARELFAASGLTLDEIGTKMGYEGDVARKSAWQFLNKTSDPRLSMLRRFAMAVGVSIVEFFSEQKEKPKMVRFTPELAAKARIIEGRILVRIETMLGGELLGDRRERLWKLPTDVLAKLADALDAAGKDERASTIIERHYHDYEDELRSADRLHELND